jgi:hypothetical protein
MFAACLSRPSASSAHGDGVRRQKQEQVWKALKRARRTLCWSALQAEHENTTNQKSAPRLRPER